MTMLNQKLRRQLQQVDFLRYTVAPGVRRMRQRWQRMRAEQAHFTQVSDLKQLAAARGKLMEQFAAREEGTQGAFKDLAFMTGILSLMDVLLEMPLADVLKELNVPVPVEAALMRHEGPLGNLLQLTEQLEHDDSDGIAQSLRKLGGSVAQGDLMALQLAAYRWANEVATPA